MHSSVRLVLSLAALCTATTLVAAQSSGPASLPQPGGPATFVFSPAAQQAVAEFTSTHTETFLSVRGAGITRVYGKAFSQGPSPIQSADAFVQAHSGMFGVAPGNLLPIGPFPDGARLVPLVFEPASDSFKFTLVAYTQHLNGIPVFRGDLRVLVRNEPGFPAVLASSSLRDLGAFAAEFQGGPVAPSRLDEARLLRIVQNQFRQKPVVSEAEMVIWAGVDEEVAEPRLAYKFVAEGGLLFQPENYRKFLYVVDAATGRILFQENMICEVGVSGIVRGTATQGTGADLCEEESPVGMPYARVTSDGVTTFADVDGNFSFEVGNPLNVTSQLGGFYFTVNDQAGPVSSIDAVFTGAPVDFVHNEANSSALVRAQVNAYLHANIIRDVVMGANPNYPVIAGQFGPNAFPINVNIANTCNAFYNGSSINFYQAGGGCANTAFSTVVHHEFGHHVVASGGSGQGAYGEGMSDCMGIIVTDESITGRGFQNNCESGIRNADNDCQYVPGSCSSCGSAIHSCGRLISGCVWDLRENWAILYPEDYLVRLQSIVVNSVPLHGPVSTITPDITIDFLTLDDDNGDLNDGTPNYVSIADAFGQHNMPAPPLQPLTFTYPNGRPSTVDPSGSTILTVEVGALTTQPQPGTGVFLWRNGSTGSFASVPMTQTSPNVYQVAVPATACLSTVQWYVQAETAAGIVANNPPAAPATVYSAISATQSAAVFADEMEFDVPGWIAGLPSDTATSGQWVRVDPNGTAAQPEDDRTPDGTDAWITGQGSPGGALGEADVDNGITTLVSPVFDATGWDEVFITYWRWYSNNTGASPNADSMPVEISNNGGSTWVQLELVTENANAWVFKSFRIADFVTPTNQMRVRWIARDLGAGSLVEAGVDDVAVVAYSCEPLLAGDLDGDGVVGPADLSILLGAWGTAGPGDLDGDGVVGPADLSILLGSWG